MNGGDPREDSGSLPSESSPDHKALTARLPDMEARCVAASEGLWATLSMGGGGKTILCWKEKEQEQFEMFNTRPGTDREADIAFVCESRKDLPDLLAAYKDLLTTLTDLRAEMEDYNDLDGPQNLVIKVLDEILGKESP